MTEFRQLKTPLQIKVFFRTKPELYSLNKMFLLFGIRIDIFQKIVVLIGILAVVGGGGSLFECLAQVTQVLRKVTVSRLKPAGE